ncbi:MAG: PHB depolymerase family esterase [Opitutaceae bacterium]
MRKFLLVLAALNASYGQPALDEGIRTASPATAPAAAQSPVTPSPEEITKLRAKLEQLNAAVQSLKDARFDDDLIVDVEATAWVVHNTLRVPGGFVTGGTLPGLLTASDDALRRAGEIKSGTAAWPKIKGQVKRAYRSAIDGTAQPYTVSIPASYDPTKPTPLYVYLHGRSTPGGNQANPDLAWGQVGGSDRENPERGGGARAVNYIRVNAFGRSNNSFRFAGETDVLEVIASVRQRYNIDPDRILLAGFSMGGAGSWQLGLRMPDLFCGLEINAGVIGSRLNLDGLAPAARAATVSYGITIPHALAVANLPLVAFAGETDTQLAASVSIRDQLVREGFKIEQTSQYVWKGTDIDALFLVHPNAGHAHPTGETQRLRDEYNAANFARGRVVPDHVRFVTHTTRYNRSFWVTVDGLERHFERADVDAQRDPAKANFTIKTHNISRLTLTDTAAAKTIAIDGVTLNVKPAATLLLVRDGDRWQIANPAAHTGLRKEHKLQGPINDAFFESFLCVNPTGQAFNAVAAERGQQEQDRFAKMFTRDFLGEARAKDDTAVTEADIANNNLVLFGDPGSNQLIAKIAGKLPIKWTKESIIVGGKTYSAAEHVPVLIYPNPLNPQRYVVINTGLTAQGRGAASYGDYAILKLTKRADAPVTAETVDEGVFDESWQLPPAKI